MARQRSRWRSLLLIVSAVGLVLSLRTLEPADGPGVLGSLPREANHQRHASDAAGLRASLDHEPGSLLRAGSLVSSEGEISALRTTDR